MRNDPIGVLDSGLGGLSVLRAMRARLPFESFLYCADSGNAPWGDKSETFIIERCRSIVRFLIERHSKAIVVACNTATATAIDTLRSEFSLPIIGIEPAVKPAIKNSCCGRVGVIATTRTIESERYHSLLVRFAGGTHVMSVAAPGLMECVERGAFRTDETKALIRTYLTPMLDAGIDTLVLACTHYPFLSETIQEVAGRPLTIIEPSDAVAHQLQERLQSIDAFTDSNVAGTETFFIKNFSEFEKTLRILWPSACNPAELPI